MALSTRIILLTGRLALAALVLGVLAVVAIQFEGIVAKNVAVASEVRASRTEIARLEAREVQQRRTIARLRTPLGALPEIHDKLHLVGPNEEIIFLRGTKPSHEGPRHWDESQ